MKECISCHQVKNEEDFSFRDKLKGKRNNKCRICHKIYVKQHYLNNRDSYLEKAKKFNSEHRKEHNKRLVEYLKDKSCMSCGEDDLRVLDFHHRNKEEKRYGIAKMIRTQHWNTILREIEKCDIMCSNCHRKKTAKEFDWYKNSFYAERI